MGFNIGNIEKVVLIRESLPKDYHCDCRFCRKFAGTLKRPDGTYYSKWERNRYYAKIAASAHIAKTPLHIARWAVQEFTKKGEWVLDPTIGIGTTAVEALIQQRNAAGMEIEYYENTIKNIEYTNWWGMKHQVIAGDAREVLKKLPNVREVDLVVTNPPYSGDEGQKVLRGKSGKYDKNFSNLAFLGESTEYYETMFSIYSQCKKMMKKGAFLVMGVKDMVREKRPYILHFFLGEVLEKLFTYRYMVLLPHYPPTLFMNTYNKRFPETRIPVYQTVLVFENV
ncbi:MAG: DNA methyltransferase [Dehalococcoidales bacterium]|jgi:DNA modification methylase|nr:DNA methyltransferase [Dehalococcoidales bacterium]